MLLGTPHTCQKSCRKGGAKQEGGKERERDRKEGEEEEGRGKFLERDRGSFHEMIGGGNREKSGDIGRQGIGDDNYSQGREERDMQQLPAL